VLANPVPAESSWNAGAAQRGVLRNLLNRFGYLDEVRAEGREEGREEAPATLWEGIRA